jgi:hypothetical protein
VYDIEVEGTHNFVGNDIIAHNTYLNGNVGIGSAVPLSALDVKGGAARVWSGTGTVDYATTPGSLYVQDRLEVDGDVYLGDAVTDKLTVLGAFTLAGNTNYTGPLTITTTHPSAFLVEKSDGTDVLNINTQGTLATLTGSMTVSGDTTFAGNTTVGGNAIVNGNVGIGTIAPAATLQLTFPGAGVMSSTIDQISDLGGSGINLNRQAGAVSAKTGIYATFYQNDKIGAGVVLGRDGTTNWGTYVSFHTHPDNAVTDATAGAFQERMRINQNGYVGIGSITPRTVLDVAGGMQISGLSTLTGGAVISADVTLGTPSGNYTSSNADLLAQGNIVTDSTLYGGSMMLSSGNTVNAIATTVSSTSTDLQLPTAAAVYTYVSSGASTMISDSDSKVFIKDGTATPINFQIDGSTSVVIDRNGNVGIGTATPAQKMSVNGNVSTTGDLVVSDNHGLADSTDTPRVQITATKVIINLQ